ncbi:MAG: hypothetical protein HY363_03575 [Candidatus Aenigmarchaeota archaeon]|nr:hypothetical protein [Candidatus Aenigmarchaeota archaeon]
MTGIENIFDFDDLLIEGREKIRYERRKIREYEFRIPLCEMKLQGFLYQMQYFVVEIGEKNIRPDSRMFAVVFGDHIHMSIIASELGGPRYVSSVCCEQIHGTKIIKRFFLSSDAGPKFTQDPTIAEQAIEVYAQLVKINKT